MIIFSLLYKMLGLLSPGTRRVKVVMQAGTGFRSALRSARLSGAVWPTLAVMPPQPRHAAVPVRVFGRAAADTELFLAVSSCHLRPDAIARIGRIR